MTFGHRGSETVGGKKDRASMGVGLGNLWVQPDVHVITDDAVDEFNQWRRASLKIDGLLCSLEC